MRRCLAIVTVGFALASSSAVAHADFRVFEANAPRSPSPAEPRQGLGAVVEQALHPAAEAGAPDTGTQTGSGTQADAGTQADTGTQAGTGTQADTGTQAGTGTQADTGTQAGTGTQADTGTQANTGTQAGTGTQANTGTSAAGVSSGTQTASDSAEAIPERRPFLDDHRWLDLTGFLQPGYIARLENPSEGISAGVVDDTFWLQRARIGLRAQLFEWLRLRLEVDFAPTAVLQDAFVDVVPSQYVNVRAGQFIVPFLRAFSFNEVNLGFLDRALYTPQTFDRGYIRYLAPRDIGLMVFGSVGDRSPDHHDPVLDYQLAVMSGRGPNLPLNEDAVFLYAARLNLHVLGVPVGVEAESDIARNHHTRVAVGAAGYSNCDDRGNWNRGFTVDGELRYEGLYASASFVWFRNSASDGTFLSDSPRCRGEPGPVPGTSIDFVSRGAHVQAQWVLPRFWGALGTPLDLMDLEVLARFDWVDGNSPYDNGNPLFGGGVGSPGYVPPPSYIDSDNPPSRWRLTFGLNYFPTGQQTLKLSFNYQLNREIEDVVTGMATFRGVSNDIAWVQATIAL
ncbi:MAG: hypothetical protein K1X94_33240 [Sandaracinaceae bacterium]|nr:hypothetical protein [Sandaracinaceae bacterium]